MILPSASSRNTLVSPIALPTRKSWVGERTTTSAIAGLPTMTSRTALGSFNSRVLLRVSGTTSFGVPVSDFTRSANGPGADSPEGWVTTFCARAPEPPVVTPRAKGAAARTMATRLCLCILLTELLDGDGAAAIDLDFGPALGPLLGLLHRFGHRLRQGVLILFHVEGDQRGQGARGTHVHGVGLAQLGVIHSRHQA